MSTRKMVRRKKKKRSLQDKAGGRVWSGNGCEKVVLIQGLSLPLGFYLWLYGPGRPRASFEEEGCYSRRWHKVGRPVHKVGVHQVCHDGDRDGGEHQRVDVGCCRVQPCCCVPVHYQTGDESCWDFSIIGEACRGEGDEGEGREGKQ